MGLQGAYSFNGLSLPETYHRIVQTNRSVEAENVAIVVHIYQDMDTRENKGNPFKREVFHANEENYAAFFNVATMNEVDKNIVSQSYAFLKSLDNYTNYLDN